MNHSFTTRNKVEVSRSVCFGSIHSLIFFSKIVDIVQIVAGSRWKVKALTYKISKYPSTNRLTKREVDSEIKKALNVWAEVTDLTFEQRLFGKVHIDIKFETRMHGDGDPFDGTGGTLAHAYFPGVANDSLVKK